MRLIQLNEINKTNGWGGDLHHKQYLLMDCLAKLKRNISYCPQGFPPVFQSALRSFIREYLAENKFKGKLAGFFIKQRRYLGFYSRREFMDTEDGGELVIYSEKLTDETEVEIFEISHKISELEEIAFMEFESAIKQPDFPTPKELKDIDAYLERTYPQPIFPETNQEEKRQTKKSWFD